MYPPKLKSSSLLGAWWQLPAWWLPGSFLKRVGRGTWAEEGNRVTGIALLASFVAEGGAYPEDTVKNILKSQVRFCSLQFKDTLQMQFV